MQNKKSMLLWIAIVLLVIAFLLFITIKKSKTSDLINEDNEKTEQMEGVLIKVLQEGSDDMAKVGDNVSMNYTGSLEDGTVFDSNIDPKFGHVLPFTFTLGERQVIKGWDVGVVGMKKGEKRRLEINSEYAYGEKSIEGIIPPNANLIYEVELVEIIK